MKPQFLKETAVVSLLLGLLISTAFYDVVFMGKTMKTTTGNPQSMNYGPYGQKDNGLKFYNVTSTDSSMDEENTYEFIKDSLHKGIIPLWNPHQALGYPLIAMIQLGIFFPLNFIFYLLPNAISWDAAMFARFLCGGIFAYWFMRVLKYNKIPSTATAIVYALSGPMTTIQLSMFINVEITLPLLLLTYELLVQKPDMRRCSYLAIVVALTFYAGHPEHILLVNAVGFLFFVFRVAVIKRAEFKKLFVYLLGSYLLAFGLCALVVFPFLRSVTTEFWHNHPENMGVIAGGPKNELIGLLMPYYFQNVVGTLKFARPGWLGGYLGLIPLGLSVLSLFSRDKQKLNYFFFALGTFIVLKSFFSWPIVKWIGYLPFFNIVRFYVHTPHILGLIVAILAGMGMGYFLSQKNVFLRGLTFTVPVSLIVLGLLYSYKDASHFEISKKASIFALCILLLFQFILFLKNRRVCKEKVIGVILVIFIFFEIYSYIPHKGRANRFDSFPEVPYITYLKNAPERARTYGILWAFLPNTGSGYQLDDLGIILGLLPKRYVKFVNRFIIPDYFKSNLHKSSLWVVPITFFKEVRPYLFMLNIKYTIAPKNLYTSFPISQRPNFPKPFYSKEVYLFRLPALPRAYVVHRAVFEPDEDAAFDAIYKIRNNFREVIVVQHDFIPEINQKINKAPLLTNSKASITTYSPNEVVVSVDMKHDGFLVLSDGYHPEWNAYVDGKKTKIFITNYLIRSVFLPAGQHEVAFKFQPLSLTIGVWVSLLSLILTVFFIKKNKFFI